VKKLLKLIDEHTKELEAQRAAILDILEAQEAVVDGVQRLRTDYSALSRGEMVRILTVPGLRRISDHMLDAFAALDKLKEG